MTSLYHRCVLLEIPINPKELIKTVVQLVVVGDQSSGKSSLLEGLTGLPFPVASQLCTRFATKVSFRRSATAPIGKTITITIIPAKDASEPYKQQLASFTHKITEFTAETFKDMLQEVNKLCFTFV